MRCSWCLRTTSACCLEEGSVCSACMPSCGSCQTTGRWVLMRRRSVGLPGKPHGSCTSAACRMGVCMGVHTTAQCNHSYDAEHPADFVAQSRQGPPLGWAAAGGGGRAAAPGEQHHCRHAVPPVVCTQGQLLWRARGGNEAMGAWSAGCRLRKLSLHEQCMPWVQLAVRAAYLACCCRCYRMHTLATRTSTTWCAGCTAALHLG